MSLNPRNVILYAEDDEDDQQLVKEHLSKYSSDIEIIIQNNGVDALSYLNNLSPEDSAPCLIILDINMPKMNGLEALRLIRKNIRFANTPAIIFTTSSHMPDRKTAAEYNASFITKPIDSNQMNTIAATFIKHCEKR